MTSPLLAIRGLETTTPAFRQRLCDVAHNLRLDASYLAAVMCVETGGTFSPSIRNPHTGAVGLIQFMPETCLSYMRYAGLASAFEQEAAMFVADLGAVGQLSAVDWYFRNCGALPRIRYDVPGDYYMAVFMPKYVGKPHDHVLFPEDTKGYLQNKGLDKNKDGAITVGDCWSTIDKVIEDAVKRGVLGV